MKKSLLLLLSLTILVGLKAQVSNKSANALNAPTQLTGVGLQVSGQSTSPRDVKFTWVDNATDESFYRFERRRLLVWWKIDCEAPANATSKTHQLSFMPGKIENFRLSAVKLNGTSETRSDYAYVNVEMLRPDLCFENARINKTAFRPGEYFQFDFRLINIGTYSSDSITISCVLSNKNQHITLGSCQINSIDPSIFEDMTLNYKMPDNVWGESTVYLKVKCKEKEIGTFNNMKDFDIFLGAPELGISTFTINKTTCTPSNNSVNCTIKVANTGNIASTPCVLKLSYSKTINNPGTLLTTQAVNVLQSGGSQTITTTVNMPASMVEGPYYIVAFVDGNYQISEAIETNNIKSNKIEYLETPDYSLSNLTFNGSWDYYAGYPAYRSEDSYGFKCKVKNSGPSRDYVYIDAYLSEDKTISTNDTPLGSFSVSDVAYNNTVDFSDGGWLPEIKKSGLYYLIAKVRVVATVWETNETNLDNNTISGQIYCYEKDTSNSDSGNDYSINKSGKLNSALKNINIFPNPSNGTFNIEGLTGFNSIKIFNLQGAEVLSFNHISKDTQIYDLSYLEKGVYIIQIFSKTNIVSNKIIIE